MNPFTYDIWKAIQRDAGGRLKERMGQEDVFGTPFEPTAQDLIDYETATGGVAWPKEKVTMADFYRMQQDIGGTGEGLGAAVNVPEETVARPLSRSQAQLRDVLEKERSREIGEDIEAAGQPEKWQRKFSMLKDFLPQGFTDEDILANMGFSRGGEEKSFSDPYQGPGGSLLQRDSSGKVYSVLGRADDKTGEDPAEKRRRDTERQFRNDTLRLYGASEFSSLDESTRDRVNEVARLAAHNYLNVPNASYNQVLENAYRSTESKYNQLSTLPRYEKSMIGDNYKIGRQRLQSALEGGVRFEDAAKEMVSKGWRIEDIRKMVDEIGRQAPAQPAPSPAQPRPATAQPAQPAMSDEIRRKYFELRNLGLSPEQAAQRLGIMQ